MASDSGPKSVMRLRRRSKASAVCNGPEIKSTSKRSLIAPIPYCSAAQLGFVVILQLFRMVNSE
ncbi:hypothetical protein BDW75DRAFT_186350 [Aspergillus navahoensis]